jgi:hypothetical protein
VEVDDSVVGLSGRMSSVTWAGIGVAVELGGTLLDGGVGFGMLGSVFVCPGMGESCGASEVPEGRCCCGTIASGKSEAWG